MLAPPLINPERTDSIKMKFESPIVTIKALNKYFHQSK